MARIKVRILLADDHAIIRRELAHLLGACADMEIVGEAVDGYLAVELSRQLHPDVIIMDVLMPRMNGIEATQILHSEMPHIQVIGLSMHNESEIRDAMRKAGAVGYLSKTEPPDLLIEAIRACIRTLKDQ